MTSGSDQSGPLDDRLGTSLFGGEARTADYTAWAARLKAKRDKSRKVVADCAPPAEPTAAEPSYWSTDALYAESARVRDHEQAEPHTRWDAEARKSELADALGMHGEINLTTASEAFRRLAKLHHPDRYTTADESIRDHHAAEMMKVNGAYAALKKLLAEA
ncbi:MAG: J domain-containing protein [Actinobacteria bacterium]|nr:J domain-containing protein [Actinomycetota bacterium]